jgi:hypothetical protein
MRSAHSRLRASMRDTALALAVGALTHVGCGYLPAALLLALTPSSGGGGSDTTGQGEAVLVAPMTDRFIGALVIPNGVVVSAFETRRNGAIVPTDTLVPPGIQSAIAQALQQRGILAPQTEYLQFWQTAAPLTVQNGDTILVRFVQSQGGQPVAESRIGFGGSNEADFDGPPLSNFQAHDNPFLADAPALSRAASLAIALGMAAVALWVVRRRPAGRTA